MEDQVTPLQQKYLIQFSKAMYELRHKEHMTDVVLVCGDQRFHANKIVLAASSPLLAQMFDECAADQECVKLQNIPAECMPVLLEFMYTGNFSVDTEDIAKLTMLVSAANDLELLILVEHCFQYLLQSLSCGNVLQLREMADKLKNSNLKAQLMTSLAQSIFEDGTVDYLCELPLDWFVVILSSEDLHAESDDVLRGIITWVKADTEQRLKDIKDLLPLVDKKGLSDDFLFEIQQMDLFRICPDLIMFTLDIMTPRYRSLSSLRGSTCSLFSENSESNDTTKDEREDNAVEKANCSPGLGNSASCKETVGILSKAAVALTKDGETLPTIKEESVVSSENKKELPSVVSKGNTTYDYTENHNEPATGAVSLKTNKVIPISTSPPVKDTSPVSTPAPTNNKNLEHGSEIKRPLELTPLLLSPYVPNRSSTIQSPSPHETVNKSKQFDIVKPKEVSAKPQRTVANLDMLTVGKKQTNNGPRQPNGGVPQSANLLRGPPGDKGRRFDNDHNQYDKNRHHFGDRSRSSDDLFSRCTDVIRNHEASRNRGPNRSFDRGQSVDRNSKEPFHNRDPVYIHETRRQESLFQQDVNRGRGGPNGNNTLRGCPELDEKNSAVPAASKNRLPVTVSSSQQAELSKNVFCVVEKGSEWTLESFSTDTDEWGSPKSISKELYRHSTVVSVGHVIYFMGGTTDTWDVLKTVLMYNIRTNEWRVVAEMQVARWAAGGAQLQAYIYIVGGVSDVNTRLNHVERYNPLSDEWSSIPPLSTCREQPSVTSINDKLYVIGGYVILPQQWQMRTIETKATASGEIYDPSTRQWTELVTPLNIGREVPDKTFCTTALNDRLFAIRGRTCNMESPNETPVLYEYNLTAKQWYRHAISDPELMSVAHICSMTDEQVCLVSGMGNVYVFQSTENGKKELLKCCDGEKKGLVYAVVPCASK